jgi:glycosyltransferase involved in cell wall biosynthesis
MDKVTVVVPLYNKKNYIARAIDSILRQTYPADEIVVIDDGSTDDSAEVVTKIVRPNIRLLRQDNRGEAAARNAGIQAATGSLIAMLDADDHWEPEFLEKIIGLRKRYPRAGLYASGYLSKFPQGRSYMVTCSQKKWTLDGGEVERYFRCASAASIVLSSAQAIPKKVYEAVGDYDTSSRIGVDTDMWGRIALAYSIAYCPIPLANYRNDIEGFKMVKHYRRSVPFPPFVKTSRTFRSSHQLQPSLECDLIDYENRLLLSYAYSLIQAGQEEAFDVCMWRELVASGRFRNHIKTIRSLRRLLPLSPLLFGWRFALSRFCFRNVRDSSGAVYVDQT